MSTQIATTAAGSLPTDNPFATPSDLPYGLPPFDRVRHRALPAGVHRRDGGAARRRSRRSRPATPSRPSRTRSTRSSAPARCWPASPRPSSTSRAPPSPTSSPRWRRRWPRSWPRTTTPILLDRRLFARIEALVARREELGLDAEQERLLDRYHRDFVRAGAGLDDASQARLSEINAELSALSTEFKTKLLADTNDLAVHLTDEAELDGLSPDAVGAARAAAADRGLDGWLLTLVLPTVQPALASLTRRDVRRAAARGLDQSAGCAATRTTPGRCSSGLAALRAERAALLGFADHAEYVVADQTAGTSEAVDVDARGTRRPGGGERARRGRRAPGAPRGRRRGGSAAAVGLGVLRRAAAAAAVRRGHRCAAAVVPARGRRRARRLPRRVRALRAALQAPPRPARLPPRRHRLRGLRRRGPRHRPLPGRLVRPRPRSGAVPG